MRESVLNLAANPIRDHNWSPTSARSNDHHRRQRSASQGESDFLDQVPVMLSTVLGLHILLDEPRIDLQMASELVLSDVGATIQILRLIGREYGQTPERPIGMGGCLAGLEVNAWFGALSARTFSCDAENAATTALWKHCRLAAQYARLVAGLFDDISPEDAYLVGLLHDIEEIPAVLNRRYGSVGHMKQSALTAMEGSLPLFVLAAIRTVNNSSPSSTWKFILTAVHQLANTRTEFNEAALGSVRFGSVRVI